MLHIYNVSTYRNMYKSFINGVLIKGEIKMGNDIKKLDEKKIRNLLTSLSVKLRDLDSKTSERDYSDENLLSFHEVAERVHILKELLTECRKDKYRKECVLDEKSN